MTQSTPLSPQQPKLSRRFRGARSVSALMIGEMSTQYGRTPGGYIWLLLEPLLLLTVLSIAFSLILRKPSLGTSFILFYASGYFIHAAFQKLQQAIMNSLKFSRALLRYPAIIWLDAVAARFILNGIVTAFVSGVIFIGIVWFVGYEAKIDPVPMIAAFVFAILIALGTGMINSVFTALYPLWGMLWNIAMRPMLLFSAVLYIYEDLPPLGQDIIWFNPIAHLTGLARIGVYPTYNPAYISIAYVAGWALVTIFFGLLIMRRYHLDALEVQ